MSGPRVLLLDDDEAGRLTLEVLLEEDGYRVRGVACLAEARAALADPAGLDGVILDVHLPDGLGPDLIPDVRQRWPRAAVIVLSGSSEQGSSVPGADRCLTKGLEPGALLGAIAAALGRDA